MYWVWYFLAVSVFSLPPPWLGSEITQLSRSGFSLQGTVFICILPHHIIYNQELFERKCFRKIEKIKLQAFSTRNLWSQQSHNFSFYVLPFCKKGRKGANKGHRKKYCQSVLFYTYVSVTSSLTVLVLRFPQGAMKAVQGGAEVIAVASKTCNGRGISHCQAVITGELGQVLKPAPLFSRFVCAQGQQLALGCLPCELDEVTL